MAEVLDSGHVVTDEDVDTARLIMELDRALGRSSDPLTQQVAATPPTRVRTLLEDVKAANGHDVPGADSLVQALISPENTAELARDVADELPDLDPADKPGVTDRIEEVLRRRLSALVARTDPKS